MSTVCPCTIPTRIRSSPSSRDGSSFHRSVLPATDRHGAAVEHRVVRQRVLEVVAVDHVHPIGDRSAERVVRVIQRLGVQRVVVARQEEHGAVGPRPRVQLVGQAAPPHVVRLRLVEQVARAQHRVDPVGFRHAEHPVDHVHAGAHERELVLLREGGEAHPEVPVGGMQEFERHVAVLHAITNSASRIRSQAAGA